VATLDTPDGGFPLSGVLKAKQRLHYKSYRGKIVAQKWPRRRGPPRSFLQGRWVEWFKQTAQASKTPYPEDMCNATQLANGTGWYYRDVLERAMRGKLLVYEGETKITTPTCFLTRSTAQNHTGAEYITIQPDTERWDNNDFWTPLTNPTRVTIRDAGLYILGGSLLMDGGSDTVRNPSVRLTLNGTTIFFEQHQRDSSLQETAAWTTVWYFDAFDYFEVSHALLMAAAASNVKLTSLWMVAITPESVT